MALFLPSKFQQDIQGRNTNLVPIVVIETAIRSDFPEHNINLSTVSMSMRHIRYHYFSTTYNDPLSFLPLLLNVPSVKESIDLDKRKHKINTITLNLSNMPYEGKRLSDRIAESDKITNTLKNTRVSIQWVSPQVEYYSTFQSYYISANNKGIYYDVYSNKSEGDSGYSFTEKMAFMAYSGVCTKYTHDDTKVTLTIEDRTELDFHQDLPIQNDTNWLSTNTSVPDKYRGKPKPMVYGFVDKSPCVLDANGQIVIDTKPISQLVKLSNSVFGEYEPLYMASGDTMMSVSKKVEKDLGTMIDIEDDDLEDEVLVSAIGQDQWSHSNNGVFAPADNIIQLNVANSLISNKVLQCDARHKVASISLVDRPDFKDNLISNDEIALISDDNNSTGINYNHTADYDFIGSAAYTGNALTQTITYHKLILSVKPSISDSLSSRTNQVAINGILLPNPNLVSGNNEPLTFDDENNVETSASRIYIYPIELETTGVGSYSNVIIGTPYSLQDEGYDLRSLFGFPNKHNVFNYVYDSPNGSKYIDIYNTANLNGTSLSVDHSDTLPALFFYDFCGMSDAKTQVNNGEYVIYFRHHNYISSLSEGDNFESSIELRNANINEVDVKSYVDIENIYQKQFFTTVRGRVGNDPVNGYLRQPTEIVTDIIREVKNDPNYEPERRALDSGYENSHSGFINDFTVNKKIGSKKLIENILASSPFIGRFANNGKFVFNEIPKSGGTPVHTIKEEDVINFSFTKTEDVYTKVILKSKINYLTDEFENITEASVEDLLGSQYDYNYYGLLSDHSQSTLIVDDDRGKYIRNIDAAERLAYWLLSYYANAHLKLKVDLSLRSGLNVEVGDVINFNKLIQGIKPYGINYVKDGEMLNGQAIFPTFIITSTVKTLDKITIECIQNHALATQGCTEGFDCNGICGGTAELDVCGVCDGGETDIENCEVCPEEAIDCLGVCGGTAVRDACGVCEGTCDGTPTGDCDYECGCADIPEGHCDCNGNVEDCNGVCGGEAYVDECGNCVGGTTDEEPCSEDCFGEAGGTATTEICGYCTQEGTDVDECWNEFYIQVGGYYPLNNLHLKELEITFSTGNILNVNSIVVENGEMQIQQPPNLNWQVPLESFLEDKRLWKGYYLQGGDFELLPDEYRTYDDGETKITTTPFVSNNSGSNKLALKFEHPELILQAGTIAQHLFRFPKTENSTEIEIDSVKIVHDTGSGGLINLHDISDAITFEKTQSSPSWSSTEINKHIIDVKVPDEYSNDSGIVVGDLNNDGQFNVLDVVTLAGRVMAGNQYTASGDMNGDGNLNVLDIVTLANCVLNGSCTGEVE